MIRHLGGRLRPIPRSGGIASTAAATCSDGKKKRDNRIAPAKVAIRREAVSLAAPEPFLPRSSPGVAADGTLAPPRTEASSLVVEPRSHEDIATAAEVVRDWFDENDAAASVRTTRRTSVSTSLPSPGLSVALTITDVHLRSEQLPFAYFFRESLEFDVLESSLREVLRRYPVLGGRVEYGNNGGVPRIVCTEGDAVSLSFGYCDGLTLDEWLRGKVVVEEEEEEGGGKGKCSSSSILNPRQHLHRAGQSPVLLPLFDDLFSSADIDGGNVDDGNGGKAPRLASIRVTRFSCGGTALGINLSHLLADADSCVRFAQAWGRESRGLAHPAGVSNDRSEATVAGMASAEVAELLDLGGGRERRTDWGGIGIASSSLGFGEYWKDLLPSSWGFMNDDPVEKKVTEKGEAEAVPSKEGGGEVHEYIHLPFPPDVLEAMKEYGMSHCRRHSEDSSSSSAAADFVSTNDMITAFGWLLKRHLSGNGDWNVSVVVNLRGRGGVDRFSDPRCGNGSEGVFGNALTNVVAASSASNHGKFTGTSPRGGEGSASEQHAVVGPIDVAAMATVIRRNLIDGTECISERVASSRMGRAVPSPSSGPSFAATSWQRFPLWDVRFASAGGAAPPGGTNAADLVGFHGHPSHPLPAGTGTYSSVVVPASSAAGGNSGAAADGGGAGGIVYKLLAPSRRAEEARDFHRRLCRDFVEWSEEGRRIKGDVMSTLRYDLVVA